MTFVHLQNASGYAQQIRARAHELRADEPKSHGGTDTGPAPYELLLAGLAACTSLTLRMYAERKSWQLGRIEVHLRFSRDEQGVESIAREVAFGNELSEEQSSRLADICEKTPVTMTIKRGTAIHTTFSKLLLSEKNETAGGTGP
jgi:putative redox protein